MRLLVILGAAIAFVAVTFVSLWRGKSLGNTLALALFTSVVAGLLFRWWAHLWVSSYEKVTTSWEAQLASMNAAEDAASENQNQNTVETANL